MSNLDSLIARGKRCQTRLLRARLSNQMRAFLHAQRALDRLLVRRQGRSRYHARRCRRKIVGLDAHNLARDAMERDRP